MKELAIRIKKIMGKEKAKVISDEIKDVWKGKYNKVPKSLINDKRDEKCDSSSSENFH